MAGKKPGSGGESVSVYLTVSRKEAKDRIKKQIDKGINIIDFSISTKAELEKAKNEYNKWLEYNTELLKRIFSNDAIARERPAPVGMSVPYNPPFSWFVINFQKKVQSSITKLEGIMERLELIPEEPDVTPSYTSKEEVGTRGSDVFIVHGRDEGTKQSVARFIEKLDLKTITLHEQPNAGRTIIEKFEEYSNVGFAVVLLTPDDVGAEVKEKDKLKPRARQNVIFELGFFVGKLGRNRVCALHKGQIEIPSDYVGVLFIPIDENDSWKFKLAKEIQAAGITVDLNKAIK